MARTDAVRAVQAIYEHVDNHVRELLPPPNGAVVDSALMIIAGGVVASGGTFGGSSSSAGAAIDVGVAGCWSFDFHARITGWYLQEFDGNSGSIVLGLAKAARGASPAFTSIVASAPPSITSGRYGENATLIGWDDFIDRGDLLRVSVTSVSTITRVLFGLRIRRLEP